MLDVNSKRNWVLASQFSLSLKLFQKIFILKKKAYCDY